MKRISMTLIVLVFFLNSCIIKDYSTLTEFIIKNNSEYELKIQVSNFGAEFYSSVIIGVDSQVSYIHEEKGEEAVYYYPFGTSSDSLTIYFNDTITNTFYKNNLSQYNPLIIENYSGGRVSKGLYRYTYTFTNQDFQEALKDQLNTTRNIAKRGVALVWGGFARSGVFVVERTRSTLSHPCNTPSRFSNVESILFMSIASNSISITHIHNILKQKSI